MRSIFVVPVVATLALAGIAVAQTASQASEAMLVANSAVVGADPAPADAPGGPAGPDGEHHHHFHGGFHHHRDPLANVPKPYTADAVKQAMEAWFARRPQVKSVTEGAPNILVVEIVDPDGKTHRFELNKTTGERRPAW